jgi:acetyl esterase
MKLKKDGELDLIKGIHSLCPDIAGEWPQPQFPSSIENEGIVLNFQDNRATMAYGIDAFYARNLLAWPSFAAREDVEVCRRRSSALTSAIHCAMRALPSTGFW